MGSLLGNTSLWDFGTNTRTQPSRSIREALFKRCHGHCENPYCESPYRKFRGIKDMEAGHKTPVARNGRTVLENLVALCRDCNDQMKTMSWAIFLRHEKKQLAAR